MAREFKQVRLTVRQPHPQATYPFPGLLTITIWPGYQQIFEGHFAGLPKGVHLATGRHEGQQGQIQYSGFFSAGSEKAIRNYFHDRKLLRHCTIHKEPDIVAPPPKKGT